MSWEVEVVVRPSSSDGWLLSSSVMHFFTSSRVHRVIGVPLMYDND
jgi:hypothetical protein